MRAEWPGPMCSGHSACVHTLARCCTSAAVAVTRGNTSFCKCRCRQRRDCQGGVYRADHRLAPRWSCQSTNLSDTSKFLSVCRNDETGMSWPGQPRHRRIMRGRRKATRVFPARSPDVWFSRDSSGIARRLGPSRQVVRFHSMTLSAREMTLIGVIMPTPQQS